MVPVPWIWYRYHLLVPGHQRYVSYGYSLGIPIGCYSSSVLYGLHTSDWSFPSSLIENFYCHRYTQYFSILLIFVVITLWIGPEILHIHNHCKHKPRQNIPLIENFYCHRNLGKSPSDRWRRKHKLSLYFITRHGWDVQSMTPYCHGLDIPSKSWTGHPNRDLDDFNKHPILSRIGRPIRDTTWMIHPAQSRFGWPIRDRPGWLSKPWHLFVTDWTVSKPWQSGQSYIYDGRVQIGRTCCVPISIRYWNYLRNVY
jgi:hypothetical protein